MARTEYCGRVQMTGFRDDLRRVMPNLYAVVHPAEKEGLGVALLQASACGVPVIAAEAGGIPEIVLHDQNGLTFEVGDVEKLNQCIDLLLSDPAMRERLGGKGGSWRIRRFRSMLWSKAISRYTSRLLIRDGVPATRARMARLT